MKNTGEPKVGIEPTTTPLKGVEIPFLRLGFRLGLIGNATDCTRGNSFPSLGWIHTTPLGTIL